MDAARAPSVPLSSAPFFSSCFVSMPGRLSTCLTFSVFPIYGRLLSAFFASLPAMMAAIALACFMAHKKGSTDALSIIYRESLCDDEILDSSLLSFFFLVFCFFARTDRFALAVAVSWNRVERRTGPDSLCYLCCRRIALLPRKQVERQARI